MKLYAKDELIAELQSIFKRGWHKSVKKTVDKRNDGAVGNTLETLLGIKENNLPIPNAREWELKGQRLHTSSLISLKHIEPSPRAARIVPAVLIPNYGWAHRQAGKRSFRSTTSATGFTNRGFRVVLDRKEKKVRFVFDASKVDVTDPKIKTWFEGVKKKVGTANINPEPYWGLDDLEPAIGEKMKNCFYVVADSKKENNHEFFKYEQLYMLSGFSFPKFLDAIDSGEVVVEFDASSDHNHGTKFRVKQGSLSKLYSSVKRVI